MIIRGCRGVLKGRSREAKGKALKAVVAHPRRRLLLAE